MKLSSWLSRAFLLSVLFAAGFGTIAILVGTDRIAQFDRAIIDFWRDYETPALTGAMKALTAIGSGVPVAIITIAIMLFLFFVMGHRKELILFAFALAGSSILNLVLKLIFLRERPTLHRLIEATGYSFPSGHSMGAFSLYGIVAFLLWKHIGAWWGRFLLILFSCALILIIGISRIYLGVHYPSDVLAGYLASGFWLAASITVYQRYMERAAKAAKSPRN